MFGRNKVAILVAEFLGTFVLTGVIYAVLLQRLPGLFVAAAATVTVAALMLVVGETSGGYFNPAVTVAMWTLRKIETGRAIVYIVAQFLGGAVAWRLNEYFLGMSLRSLAPSKFDMKVLVAEAVGTLIFTFGIAAAIYQGYQGLRKAITIGASISLGALIASVAASGFLNPAVALGVRSWSFAYVAGPLLGAVLGMNLYFWLFAPRPVQARAAITTRPKVAKKPVRRK